MKEIDAEGCHCPRGFNRDMIGVRNWKPDSELFGRWLMPSERAKLRPRLLHLTCYFSGKGVIESNYELWDSSALIQLQFLVDAEGWAQKMCHDKLATIKVIGLKTQDGRASKSHT